MSVRFYRISGVRDTNRKKVELKYRPTIIGGLKEILQWQTKFIDEGFRNF